MTKQRNPLCGFPYEDRVTKIHRTGDGLTLIRGSSHIFVPRGDPKFVRLIGYLGIKEGEMAWLPYKLARHTLDILKDNHE